MMEDWERDIAAAWKQGVILLENGTRHDSPEWERRARFVEALAAKWTPGCLAYRAILRAYILGVAGCEWHVVPALREGVNAGSIDGVIA
jgi:hypothetical protein